MVKLKKVETSKIVSRINSYLTIHSISRSKFASFADMPQPTVNRQLKGDSELSGELLAKFMVFCDKNDIEWILTGTRKISVFDKIGEIPSKVTECFDSKSKVKVFDEMIDGSEIPTASQDEMKEVSPSEGVPYYDEMFACTMTFRTGENNVYPDYYTRIKGMEKATFFCNASGDSMSPLIDNGDVVGLQEVQGTYFPLGEIYAIDGQDIATIKRIRKGSSDDTFLLEPINPAYDAYEIPKAEIRKIYRVVGCIKKF